MLKKLAVGVVVALGVIILVTTGCQNVEMVSLKASEALNHRNYRGALKILSELSDRTLESDDSLFLMLSEAYYGLMVSPRNLNADAICDMDFSNDGQTVWFTDLQNGKVVEYSYPDLRFKRTIETGSPCYAIDLSPDNQTFAAALSNSSIDIFDLQSGERMNSLSGHTNRARAVVYTDSKHLVSGGNDQNIITWDMAQNKVLDNQWRHRKNVKSLKRSSDGNLVVSTSNDGTAIVWDYTDKEKGKELNKVVHGRNYVNDAVLSPDNKILVTVSGDGDAKVWDANYRILKETIPLEDVGCSVDYSPDGKYVAVGGNLYVHIINTDTWTVEEKYPIANDSVWGIKFLDGSTVAFADSSHFYDFRVLTRKELINTAKEWVKKHG